MRGTLPDTIVPPLEQVAGDLTDWAARHPDADLATIEQTVLARVRAALPAVLGAVVAQATRSLRAHRAPPSLRCPGCGKPVRVQSWRRRQVQTICGPLALERPWYSCRDCHHGFSPTDQALGLGAYQRLSSEVHDQITRLGAATTFRDSAELLECLTGTAVAPETVRAHTEAEGAAREARQQEAITQVEQRRAPPDPVEEAPGDLVVETDGAMVRYLDAWHEVKLGVIGGQVNGQLCALSYVAAREGPTQFGPRLLAEAARRGALERVGWENARVDLARLRRVTVVGDGAVWIWHLADEHFGTRIEIVDCYHASEHLWNVARALFGAEAAQTAAWAQAQTATLREHGGTAVVPILADLVAPTDAAATVLRTEQGYFRTNAARMDYPRYRALGLPCGSGAVESAAKHLVQHRMKRPGARWSEDGAQAVLTLRCDLLSHRRLAA